LGFACPKQAKEQKAAKKYIPLRIILLVIYSLASKIIEALGDYFGTDER
jgi:hypothetical protein